MYFSYRQLVLHTLAIMAGFGMAPQQGRLRRDDIYMPLTPMSHVHAWGFPYAATTAGLKQVYPGRYVRDIILKLYAGEGRSVVRQRQCAIGAEIPDWQLSDQ